jgi:predicted DNA binding CopG/RHH family protein
MKKQLRVPHFKTEAEERAFWDHLNLADYFDPQDAQSVTFPNLKPTSKSISIRLPESLLNRIKEKANAMDIPYQSLIKSSLQESFFAK